MSLLEEIQQNRITKLKDITARWEMTRSTAKHDIARLVALKCIRFTGSNKMGRYELTTNNKLALRAIL